jgi:hypothetical protein
VYEAESGPNARNQGGTLDLHAETGLKALEAAGLLDVVMSKARTGDAESMKIMRGDGTVVYDENTPGAGAEQRGGEQGEAMEYGGRRDDEDGKEGSEWGGIDTLGRPEIDRYVCALQANVETCTCGDHLLAQLTIKFMVLTKSERTFDRPSSTLWHLEPSSGVTKSRKSPLHPRTPTRSPLLPKHQSRPTS